MYCDDDVDPGLRAMRQATQHIPSGSNLHVIYQAYKTSLATRLLRSEINRHMYPDALIENPQLGPLTLLCVRSLATTNLPHIFLPLIADDPEKMRVYYDNLSVDLPLNYSHWIVDQQYWKRVVLAKSSGKCYAYNTFNWKNLGISLLLVEIIESYPAEFWNGDYMKALASEIKQYITELHISRLQSLSESSFARHIKAAEGQPVSDSDTSITSKVSSDLETDLDRLSESELEHMLADAHRRQMRRKQLLLYKERRLKDRLDRALAMDQLTANMPLESTISVPKKKTKKKKKKKKKNKDEESPPPSLFDIEVELPEEESMLKIPDWRNKDAYLRQINSYKYPPEHCHHINLNFVRFFSNLVSFTLEFLGPKLNSIQKYHDRHLNFSTKDIERLAYGIGFLHQLKVFRLRNSRMNAEKLNVLTQSLRDMDKIESIDFGYDLLVDDCGKALNDLFLNTPTIKSLELEGNRIGVESLRGLADGLAAYNGTLDYLGLAGTLLGDEALHVLNASILGTEHIKQLCLVGATISQNAIICCIAQELMMGHPALVHLDIGSIIIDLEAADKVLRALQLNTRLQYFNCRGCELPYEMELEACIVQKRNKFLLKNPFVGDATKTVDEIESATRTKNPILLRALDAVEKRKQCYADKFAPVDRDCSEDIDSHRVVDLCAMTEEQFKQHIDVPGPNDRFRYFRKYTYGRSY